MADPLGRKIALALVLLGLTSQPASPEQSVTSSDSLRTLLMSTIGVLDRWFEVSGSTTYGTIQSMRLTLDATSLVRRKAALERAPGSSLEPAEVTFAIVSGGPRVMPLSPEARAFANVVRRILEIPDELDCSVLTEPREFARQPLVQAQRHTFTKLMDQVSSAPDVTRQLQRSGSDRLIVTDISVFADVALGMPVEEALPSGQWLAGVADDVASYMLSCTGPRTREAQLLFLRAILQIADDDDRAALEAAKIKQAYESQECSLYPVNMEAAARVSCSSPRICLALSGGGVRSAAFQVGVLQGLYDAKFLSQVDIISAVSGGAYAAGWFINQRLAERSSPAIPAYSFLLDSSLQASDKDRSQLVTTTEGVVAGIIGLIVAPIELIRDRMSSIEPRRPTFFTEHYLYRRLLSRALSLPTIYLDELETELRSTLDLPFTIFVATSHKGPCLDEKLLPAMGDAADLERNVFEFSAHSVGSLGLGLFPDDRSKFRVDSAVTISGAAMDLVTGSGCSAVRRAQIRLGARFNKDLLSDGGFSDNLALFPLVRRDCEMIIISDAEYDPEMVFGSYQRLKAALASQQSVLSLPELDDKLASSTRPCCQRIPKDRKRQCFVAPACPRNDGTVARTQERSWFVGSLGGVDAADRIPVVYLKLSLDAQSAKILSRPAIHDALSWECPIKKCSFPQIPTKLQKLPPEIGAALRELGSLILREAMAADAWGQQEALESLTQLQR